MGSQKTQSSGLKPPPFDATMAGHYEIVFDTISGQYMIKLFQPPFSEPFTTAQAVNLAENLLSDALKLQEINEG